MQTLPASQSPGFRHSTWQVPETQIRGSGQSDLMTQASLIELALFDE